MTIPNRTTSRTKGIGMNTHLNIDYNIDKPFADAMRMHRQWNGPTDANGWPTADAEVLVYNGLRPSDIVQRRRSICQSVLQLGEHHHR